MGSSVLTGTAIRRVADTGETAVRTATDGVLDTNHLRQAVSNSDKEQP